MARELQVLHEDRDGVQRTLPIERMAGVLRCAGCRDGRHTSPRSANGELHPRQQDLLREIGITAEAAQARQTARYHPTGARIDFAVGLAHARDYASVHGHLALPHPVQHNGFPLGRWLTSKRGEAGAHARRTPAPWPGMQALAALDPWWFPPWAFAWQRDYHRLRLLLIAGLEPPPKLRSWFSEQLAQRHALLPGQQRLLQELRTFPV